MSLLLLMICLLLVIVTELEMRGRHPDQKACGAGHGGGLEEFRGGSHRAREPENVPRDIGQGTLVTLDIIIIIIMFIIDWKPS